MSLMGARSLDLVLVCQGGTGYEAVIITYQNELQSNTSSLNNNWLRIIDAQLLRSITDIADITTSRCVAELGNAEQFKNRRDLTAWLGLCLINFPAEGSWISKCGNKHLQTLFIHGARANFIEIQEDGGRIRQMAG